MSKVLFLQTEFSGLAAGTPVEECKPTSTHLQTRAIVKSHLHFPYIYVKPLGEDEDHKVMAVPRFEGIVGETHPLSPQIHGPFGHGEITVTHDRLPEKEAAWVVFAKSFPYAKAVIVLNTSPAKDAKVVFKEDDLTITNREDFIKKIYVVLEKLFPAKED